MTQMPKFRIILSNFGYNDSTMFLLERIISVVAPHECIVCGQEGPLVCRYCEPDLCLPLPPHCYRCNALTANNAVCTACRRVSPLRHVWIASDYNGYPKQLIYKLKFEGAQAAAGIVSRAMQDATPYLEDVILVPIPTATSRIRQRGYDHAKLLADKLGESMRLLIEYLLRRVGQTRQVGTKRHERQVQLQDAFWPVSVNRIRGTHILLVDDVITTGSTLEQAAKVLKLAGAKSVDAVVFAQKR